MAAIEQDPNDSEALYFLGGALLQEDRVEQAEPYLERAMKLKPSFWGNYYYLGKAKFQMKEVAQAVPLLEKAAALNSSESAVFYQLGRALKAVGRTRQSRDTIAGQCTQTRFSGKPILVLLSASCADFDSTPIVRFRIPRKKWLSVLSRVSLSGPTIRPLEQARIQ